MLVLISSIKIRQHRDVSGKLILLPLDLDILLVMNIINAVSKVSTRRFYHTLLSFFVVFAVPLPLSKADLRTLMCRRVFLSENNSNTAARSEP
jgi:hypothetical protein